MGNDQIVFEAPWKRRNGETQFVARGQVNGRQTRIVWYGGPYIDIQAPGPGYHEWRSFECWNVWDYADGEPDIPVTKQAFRRYVRDKLADPQVLEDLAVCRRETFYPEVV